MDNKIFKGITEDVAKLTSTITQPDKFASIFCETAKTQKNIDQVLKDIIVDLLAKNSEAQQAIASVVEKVDRNYQRAIEGKIGIAIGAAIWTITLILVEAIIYSYFR